MLLERLIKAKIADINCDLKELQGLGVRIHDDNDHAYVIARVDWCPSCESWIAKFEEGKKDETL